MWRHNDRRSRMTLADLKVDIVPIVRSIAGKRRNRSGNLLEQGTNLRGVIDIVAGRSAAMICPHASDHNTFNLQRHLISQLILQIFCAEAAAHWQEAADAAA
jgi:hypothetical protein